MKKVFFAVLSLIFSASILLSQAPADSSYNKQIDLLEAKISKIKELPQPEQKRYFAVLSDVENRKNTLKSLLKTPSSKRDKAWEESWKQNYSKASGKLDNIQLK